MLSKFNGTSTPKGSYRAITGDDDCNVNSSRYSLSTALCESIRCQAKTEQNVRQNRIPRARHGEATGGGGFVQGTVDFAFMFSINVQALRLFGLCWVIFLTLPINYRLQLYMDLFWRTTCPITSILNPERPCVPAS